ncbi:molybdenum cofactor synthesis domain-containing protein [Roseobacter ponti]|uniref:Molybdopterin molybdenumtransferase n=1 Tax=Roseobacter ponti TaxID=1891787 RepID=A0A858SW86_9RHOB|nr:gephyrin-like molybdotransferase Glp [Roseobacter ponti]QJF52287.1 molybdopterin molybdenumtransferase MoeA [Roseobacter ponti]
MTGFQSFLTVDWSAASTRGPTRPKKDAIWLGIVRNGEPAEPEYCRDRHSAEARIASIIREEQAAGRRLLVGFDFPFGYPRGFARRVTGSDDPLDLWDWFEARITDHPDSTNNRFDIAEEMNAIFEGAGPFWGKSHKDRWPGIPYRKEGIRYDVVSERRSCDLKSGASSSCFQLFYNPTVGSQILMGLPVLARLRRLAGVAVWPFTDWQEAPVVLAEIWPGLIEPAVRTALATAPAGSIRDAVQVTALSRALSALGAPELQAMLEEYPDEACEEAWILGAGHAARLSELAATDRDVPPLRNDCFALPPGVHWTPVDEALDHLKRNLTPVTPVRRVPVGEATGRITAAGVLAARANPPLPNTAVDGYGFAGGLPEGLHRLPLATGRAAAGDAPGVLTPGHALRVLTGAALPAGIDTVVLQEDVRITDGHVVLHGPVKAGANTRKAGEDIKAGAQVLAGGLRIGPAEAALLAATGTREVQVHDPLRVAVLSTGAELVEAGETAADGQIFDANRPMLLELIRRCDHTGVDMGRVGDNRAELRARLDEASRRADVILTSGGASAGDEDHVSALLQETGTMQLWRIAVKPGRPLALGMWNGVPVFGLPGNPVAAMVCALIFARPALSVMAGGRWSGPQGFMVPAAFSKKKKSGRTEYLRARIRDGAAEVFASEGSGRISGLSWAEGLVELPPGAATITPGVQVRYIPFSGFGL